jgi:calcineurin-like phosphoesterase family protein
MSQVFFIADTHFGHRAICKYRPEFKTPEEHDEHIIENWNKVVTKKSFVWVLGDMCIENKFYNMDKLISRLNGNIRLITGNHCHLEYYNHIKIKIMNGIIKKYGYWLSHCPIHPVELRGKQNIHGHVHYKSLPDKRYINVCCEVINYTPISLDEIRRLK